MNEKAFEAPIFVVGPLRSGTTLLRLMLDNHSDICNFGEFEYATKFARGSVFPETSEFIAKLNEDRQFCRDQFFINSDLSYCELIRSFLRQAHERSTKRFISASIHGRFDLIKQVWPNARFIFLLRDPRDVARSCIQMGWCGNVWYGSDYWKDVLDRWDGLMAQIEPSDFSVVRYEDLVRNPQSSLAGICDFIGIPYDESMLRFHETSTYQPIDVSLAEQWKTKLSKAEIGLVEGKCAGLMRKWGYEVTTDATGPGPLRRIALFCQSRTWRLKFNFKRYGLLLYVKMQLARRILPRGSSWRRTVLRQAQEVETLHLK
ncbi:sulfotransferase family protein [Blastopirellula marina]|uniref:Sulfotransferase n=1 Tax=Blastopirellula marina TaxID=124 RepID=A0A2S8GNF0_9BACT|nr:sulfotransferase [Blastopirellula marina]PQO45973.1 sulfotransferase [Blastopirellula marina]